MINQEVHLRQLQITDKTRLAKLANNKKYGTIFEIIFHILIQFIMLP